MNPDLIRAALSAPAANSTQRLVLLLLAIEAGEAGVASPGAPRLAAQAVADASTIRRAIKQLADAGTLVRTPQYRDDGGRANDTLALADYTPPVRKTRDDPVVSMHTPPPDPVGDMATPPLAVAAVTPLASGQNPRPPLGAAPTQEDTSTHLPTDKPKSAAVDVRGRKTMASRLFHATAPEARHATTIDKISFALRDAQAAGYDLNRVVGVTLAYLQSPEQQAMGAKARLPHWIIDDGEWIDIEAAPKAAPPPPAPDPEPATVSFEGRAFDRPRGQATDAVGTEARPGPGRQLSWLRRCWPHTPSSWDVNRWGPMPDQPGNRIWPSVWAAFAIEQEKAA